MINCAVFEAWANLFPFFVHETSGIVPRCLLLCLNMHVRPTDKERLQGVQAYVKLKNELPS